MRSTITGKIDFRIMKFLARISLGCLLCAAAFHATAEDSMLAARRELAGKVKSYQEAKDCDGIKGLFYMHGVDKKRKSAFSRTVEDYICTNFSRPIASIAFQTVDPAAQKQPSDFEGKHSAFTLPPSGVIVIDYGQGSEGQARSLSFLYGLHDGKAWLIATRNAEAK